MTMTKSNRWLFIGVASALVGLAGCDPYEEPSDATPAVVRALVADASFSGAINPVVVNAPNGTGVWEITGVNAAQTQLIVVTTNKLLNGASIQATPDDCTPTAGSFTFDQPGTWSACYFPNSASEDWGSSVIFYNGDPTDPTTAALAAGTTYNITANITDAQNKPLQFSVRVITAP